MNMAREGRLGSLCDPPESDQGKAGPKKSREQDIFEAIRKLAELRDLGVLSEDEYQAKKDELLSRL